MLKYPICKSHIADRSIILQVLRPAEIFLFLGHAIRRGYCGFFDQHPVSAAMCDWGFPMTRSRVGLPTHLMSAESVERAMITHFLTPTNPSRSPRELCTEKVMLLGCTHPNPIHRVHERLMITEHREDYSRCCSIATASICEISPYMVYIDSVREFQFTSLMPPRVMSSCGNEHFRATPIPSGLLLR